VSFFEKNRDGQMLAHVLKASFLAPLRRCFFHCSVSKSTMPLPAFFLRQLRRRGLLTGLAGLAIVLVVAQVYYYGSTFFSSGEEGRRWGRTRAKRRWRPAGTLYKGGRALLMIEALSAIDQTCWLVDVVTLIRAVLGGSSVLPVTRWLPVVDPMKIA